MSFLEWRRFNFFTLKKNVDYGNIKKALDGTSVTAASSGHGYFVICDSEGVIHLINRNFQITTFQGYLLSVSLSEQLKTAPLLVTVGEDELGGNPLVKVWDLEKVDRQGNPICVKNFRAFLSNKSANPTALCVGESCNILAIGFNNGSIVLYRGNLKRDRSMKQKILRSENDPVTSLAFKSSAKYTYLFVATMRSVLQYNVTTKDKEEEVYLDSVGCDLHCCVLADTIQDSPFMVARDDAVYCYTVDGRGPCYAVEGRKIFLQWLRGYLVIIAKGPEGSERSPITISSTNGDEHSEEVDKNEYRVTVLDIQNKFIVYSTVIQEVISILPEWGSFFILTNEYSLHHLIEKDLQSKLSVLFKKNLYDIAIRIAKSHHYDPENLVDIFRQYGDHLYAKGDHNGAIEQYIKTIGKLEPSYVIRKFLDSQHVDNLIKYLSALHKQGFATSDHTTLLLNCYTKLNNVHKLKEFILTKGDDIDFDVNIAINVCRYPASEDALFLAEKYGLHEWYMKILIEDHQNYIKALQYIGKLEFQEAYEMVQMFGYTLMQYVPTETTQFLKKLCTNYHPSEMLLLDQDQKSINKADPEDFIHIFLNDSKKMVDFLEYVIQNASKQSTSIYHILLDHYLHLWSTTSDVTEKSQYEKNVMSVLQSSPISYNPNMVLIMCSTRNYSPGLLYLYEESKCYYQILMYQLKCGNYQGVLSCCRKFGYQQPSLWIKALQAAAKDADFPSNVLSEILTVIKKEHLLSPLQVIEMLSNSQSLIVGNIRNYLLGVLKTEQKLIDEDTAQIKKYSEETENMKKQVEKIENSPMLFQSSRCSACNNQLELPSVHFLCQHSYHQHCYQSFVENENECPACLPNNQKILGVIKSQEQSQDIHETFHSQLERSVDGFSLIANYLSRNVFYKEPFLSHAANKLEAVLGHKSQPSVIAEEISRPSLDTKKTTVVSSSTSGRIPYETDISSSLEANITIAPKKPQDFNSETNLTSLLSPKIKSEYKNPFDEEYDDSKNPFFDTNEEDGDDYDKSLNPFED